MKKTVLTYGLISGAILGILASIQMPLVMNGTIDMKYGHLFGYSVMILSFIPIFLGVRSYRDNQGGGTITFGKAFQVGILTALITCAVYVIGWQIMFYGFMPDFGDKYAAFHLEQLEAGGLSAADLAKETAKMEKFKIWYRNPLFNMGMTFLEVFPVGLIVTLVSAAILRRKTPATLATANA